VTHGATQDEDYKQPVLEGEGDTDYERYLRTGELLSLQKTESERVHHDELLFQTVHQASELWLKLADTELEQATERIERDELAPALRLLRRSVLCMRYITDQLEMLNFMDPLDFQQIRVGALGHGAGFDSPGFRRAHLSTAKLGVAFDALLERRGLTLTELYRHGREHEDLYQLAELLIEWDERIWVWRFRHYSIVARAIGEESIGTQGTPVQVLGKLIAQRQLPKLWETRSRLIAEYESGGDGDHS
jgi:tryptophan 2,3-dioxygenase